VKKPAETILIHKFPLETSIKLAADVKMYKIRQEGIEIKEQRLRSRMGSVLMKTLLFTLSASKVVKNRDKPIINPKTKLSRKKLRVISVIGPPIRHKAKRYVKVVLREGSVNNDEYRSATLLI